MEPMEDLERRISGIAALDQPLRRELYRLLSERDTWLTRDEASEALGVPRSVAAFHLDKLAEAGVVDVTFQRRTGRTGPGAGRPAKLYRRGTREVSASVPERRYDLAGSLLAAAIVEAERTGAPVADCLSGSARAAGRVIGREAADATGQFTTARRAGARSSTCSATTDTSPRPVRTARSPSSTAPFTASPRSTAPSCAV